MAENDRDVSQKLQLALADSIDKIEERKKDIIGQFAQIAVADGFTIYARTFTILMLFNRAVNILDAIADAAKKGNIIVQTALMRMLADLPMTAYRVKLLGADQFLLRVLRKQKLNYGNAESGESLRDGAVKKKVAEDFEKFDEFYDWACNGIHFSNFDQLATLKAGEPMVIHGKIAVGSDDDKTTAAIIVNNRTAVTVTNIMSEAVRKYIMSLPRGQAF